jgi:hypothetical protein
MDWLKMIGEIGKREFSYHIASAITTEKVPLKQKVVEKMHSLLAMNEILRVIKNEQEIY